MSHAQGEIAMKLTAGEYETVAPYAQLASPPTPQTLSKTDLAENDQERDPLNKSRPRQYGVSNDSGKHHHGAIEVLIAHARSEEAIILQIAEAVATGDKERVFELAENLVGHE
jgi:hypothetical protein